MEHLHIPDYQAEIDASYAHGSIGRAKQVATSQEFADMTQNALRILKNADGMEVAFALPSILIHLAERRK